ncbi:helix-turn-helix domain-containing protein [Desulfocicer niacini]
MNPGEMGIVYKSCPGSLIEVLCCTDSFEFKPHIHDKYVVWLNTECGEHYTVKGSNNILQKYSIGIFEPGLVHSNYALPDNQRCLRSFYIDPKFFHGLAEQIERPKQENYFNKKCFKDTAVWERFARLHEILLKKPLNLETDTALQDIFLSILDRYGMRPFKSINDSCDKRVKKVIEYFYANLDSEIRLKKLAAMSDCTEFHLIRLFRKHKNMSPHAFLIQIRLEHARRLIEKGADITRTALASGFSDQSHLTRKFKARYGITPHAYKVSHCF